MNIEQIQWVTTKCNNLIGIAEGHYPLDEEHAEMVQQYGQHTLQLAKGNEEVRKAITETLIFIDNIDRAYRNYKNEMDRVL